MAKKIRQGHVRRRRKKYPYLFGTYIDAGYDREYSSEYLQASIDLQHYKGHILLRVLPERPKKGEVHECKCPSIQYPAAWMDGDDMDMLIELLTEAKKIWLMAYRTAQYEERKQKRTAQRAKERKRRAR